MIFLIFSETMVNYDGLPVYKASYDVLLQIFDLVKRSSLVYYPLIIVAKIGDIIVSLFLWFLDFVWLLAKVISLAFRLFWNMTSGTILLWMLLIGLNNFTQWLTGFIGGINFPIIAPILVYAQGMLVAVIQAMVFPLLVAIFIRMAMMETA